MAAVTLDSADGQKITLDDENVRKLAGALPGVNPDGPEANKYTFYIWAVVFGVATVLTLVSIWVAAETSNKELRTAFVGFVGLLIGGVVGILAPSPVKSGK